MMARWVLFVAAVFVGSAAAACPGGVRISAETAQNEPSDVVDTNLVPVSSLGVYQPTGRTLSGHPAYRKAAAHSSAEQWLYYSYDLGSWLVGPQAGSVEGTSLRVVSEAPTPDAISATAEWSGRWPLIPGIHVRCASGGGSGSGGGGGSGSARGGGGGNPSCPRRSCTMTAQMRHMCESKVGGCCNGGNCAPRPPPLPPQQQQQQQQQQQRQQSQPQQANWQLRRQANQQQQQQKQQGGSGMGDAMRGFVVCSGVLAVLYFGLGINNKVEDVGGRMQRSHGYSGIGH